MIRLGTPADLPALRDIFRRASLSNTGDRDNLLANPQYLILRPDGLAEGRTYVADEAGSIAGFATWSYADDITELEDLFVDPAWMRRGIATTLVSHIADLLRAQGVQRLEVTASPDALGFYRAVGFVHCGVAETEFGTAPRMVLALSAGRDRQRAWRRLLSPPSARSTRRRPRSTDSSQTCASTILASCLQRSPTSRWRAVGWARARSPGSQ